MSVRHAFRGFSFINEIIGTGLGAIVLVLVVYQFISRALPIYTPAWTTEAATFAFLWMCAALAGSAYVRGAYVGVDLISERLSENAARWYHRLIHLAVLVLAVTFVFTGWNFGMKTLNQYTPALSWNRGLINFSVCYLGINLGLAALSMMLSSDPASHKAHALAEE